MEIKINELDFKNFFEVGDIIKGFCNGYFGRDDYNNKIVIMVKEDLVLFKYIESDTCQEDGKYCEFYGYNTLTISNFLSKNYELEGDKEYKIRYTKEEFKEMFEAWGNDKNE